MSTELARLKRVRFEKKYLVGFISQNMIKKVKIEKKSQDRPQGGVGLERHVHGERKAQMEKPHGKILSWRLP
jgi:hypothetical protein